MTRLFEDRTMLPGPLHHVLALVLCLLVAVLLNQGATASSDAADAETPSLDALIEADRFEGAPVLMQPMIQEERIGSNPTRCSSTA